MINSPTLVLVCKRPKSGFSKRRLVAGLGEKRTQRIAVALLDCALEDAQDWGNPVVIAPSSQQDKGWAAALMPSLSVQVLPQISGNLGQRLNQLDVVLRESGRKRLIFIGSDAPALTHVDYKAVIRALEHTDAVLIPAADGGVVLMASNRPWPNMGNLPWSTGQLGDALSACCRASGQSVIFLRQNFDIDEPSDLIKLTKTLANDPRPARHALCKLTNEIIDTIETNPTPNSNAT